VKRKDESRIELSEMRFNLSMKGCTGEEQKPKLEIREELEINSLREKINT
jgi:hypothetical protein